MNNDILICPILQDDGDPDPRCIMGDYIWYEMECGAKERIEGRANA